MFHVLLTGIKFMKQYLLYSAIVTFSIFIGSQITEGVILVPYWQSLSSSAFYNFYSDFGPLIGAFYTVLTIAAALVPVVLAIYSKRINYRAFKFAVGSSVFAILFIAAFYVYFKGANELFYQSAFSESELKAELVTWSYWHWGRIVVEVISLTFLILSIGEIQKEGRT